MSEEQTKEATKQISHDGAITLIKDDKLNRSGMAGNIAKMLLNNIGKESFVFGIDGEWGSGKTSFVNMIKSYIDNGPVEIKKYSLIEIIKNHYRKYKVFTFVSIIISVLSCFPVVWNCKDPIYNLFAIYFYLPFFLFLLSHISFIWIKRKETIKDIGKYFPVIIDFQPWIYQDNNTRIIEYFNTITTKIKNTDKSFYNKIKKETKYYLQSIFTDAEFSIKIPGFEYKKKLSLKEPALYYKEKLSQHFKTSNYKFFIVIDDLDRLEEDEIRNTIRFLKSTADLPNTIYILAYSLKRIQEAFKEQKDYIDKIVQSNFILPLPDKDLLMEMIEERTADVFPYFKDDNNLIKEKCDSLINDINTYYISTIRELKRFLNMAFTDLSVIGRDKINEIDFFLIEIIKYFEFNFYSFLSISKKLLFIGNDSGIDEMLRIASKGSTKETISKNIMGLVNKENQEIILSIVRQLFPFHMGDSDGKSPGDFARQKRIASENYFDNYFILTESISNYSSKDIFELQSNLENEEYFCEILFKLYQNKKLLRALEELKSIAKDLDESNKKFLLKNILDFSRIKIAPDEGGIVIFHHIRDIIFGIVEQVYKSNHSALSPILEYIFIKTKDIFICVSILHNLDDKIKEDKSPLIFYETVASLKSHVQEFKKIIINKIKNENVNDFFYKNFAPVFILRCWSYWEQDKNYIKEYIKRFLTSGTNTLYFIGQFQRDFNEIDKFFPISELTKISDIIDISKLAKEDAIILHNFRAFIDNKKANDII